MTALDDSDTRLPFYVRGNYAPVADEVEAFELEVVGALPPELDGRFVRNGANPAHGVPSHWFDGDGMLHGIRLRDGRAEWYRNRWVRTKLLAGEERFDPETFEFDLAAGRANTHVVRHAGRILALEEASLPNEVSPDLDTLGPFDFGGSLTTPCTAHPHVCPETGEMHFFGYELVSEPFVTYHVADAAGRIVHSQPIEVPAPVMMHDFALSRNHAVFLDLPLVFDLEAATSGAGMPFAWRPDAGARVGLVDRRRIGSGEAVEPRWFEIDECFVFHVMNAWDEEGGDVVVLDAGRHPSMWSSDSSAFEPCHLWRWRFDLRTGRVSGEQLDEREHGFPRIDDRRTGLVNRVGWAVTNREGEPAETDSSTGVVKYDLERGTTEFHDFGPGVSTSEAVFVPASDDAGEDEGWVMSYLHDRASGSSSFAVLDATDLAADPVAVVDLPQRVPHGFHGSWFAD
ncbi:carotenoid oxygenase family protein [Ilumatobacter sp.]|uniref:carotenoid oxygenase family protein n=1 Tax=Ilumatobacter sp. TaxID=1967498 RepID=UPI003B52773A